MRSHGILRNVARMLSGEYPAAYSAPTRPPMLAPTTRSGRTRSSSSAWITPPCANPRAMPPESTSAQRGGRAAESAAADVESGTVAAARGGAGGALDAEAVPGETRPTARASATGKMTFIVGHMTARRSRASSRRVKKRARSIGSSPDWYSLRRPGTMRHMPADAPQRVRADAPPSMQPDLLPAPPAARAEAPPPAPPTWHALTSADVIERLGGSRTRGLEASEAAVRLARHGPNRVAEPERTSPWRLLF